MTRTTKTIFSLWRHLNTKKVGVLLAVLALIAGAAGCDYIPRYQLYISSTEGGSVTWPGEGTFGKYGDAESVHLVAKPDEGYRFDRWTGDVKHIDNVRAANTTITMWDDYSIKANFKKLAPPINWPLIGGTIAAVAVIVGLVIFFVDRRRSVRISFRSKVWGLLRRPATTFGQVKEDTLRSALKYALICLVVFGILAGIMLTLLGPDRFFLFETGSTWLSNNPLLLIAEVIGLSVAGGMLLIFVGGAWVHLWVYLLTGRKGHGYRQTLKALIYGATPMYLVGWVPFVGVFIGSIWAIVVTIVGLRELHGTTTTRAVAASLLAIGISAVVALLLALPALLAPAGGIASTASAIYIGAFLLLFWVALYALMGG